MPQVASVTGGDAGPGPATDVSGTVTCSAARGRQAETVSVPHFGHDATVSGTQNSHAGHVLINRVSAPKPLTRAQNEDRPSRRSLRGHPNFSNVVAIAQEDSAIDRDGVSHRRQVAPNRYVLQAVSNGRDDARNRMNGSRNGLHLEAHDAVLVVDDEERLLALFRVHRQSAVGKPEPSAFVDDGNDSTRRLDKAERKEARRAPRSCRRRWSRPPQPRARRRGAPAMRVWPRPHARMRPRPAAACSIDASAIGLAMDHRARYRWARNSALSDRQRASNAASS